eukprot:2642321-Rhodomonas_salina.2
MVDLGGAAAASEEGAVVVVEEAAWAAEGTRGAVVALAGSLSKDAPARSVASPMVAARHLRTCASRRTSKRSAPSWTRLRPRRRRWKAGARISRCRGGRRGCST